jgi:hypothetical protein
MLNRPIHSVVRSMGKNSSTNPSISINVIPLIVWGILALMGVNNGTAQTSRIFST